MYVISVSKTYWNRGVRKHRKNTRRITVVYYLDEESGKLFTKRISPLMALYYKSKIHRRRRAVCTKCGMQYVVLVKNDKQVLQIECPNCSDYETTLIPADFKKIMGCFESDL